VTNTKKKRPALIKSAEVFMTRKEASAILSGIVVALNANGGEAPDSVEGPLASIVEKINEAFDFGLTVLFPEDY
jgi:hypothetical protein